MGVEMRSRAEWPPVFFFFMAVLIMCFLGKDQTFKIAAEGNLAFCNHNWWSLPCN